MRRPKIEKQKAPIKPINGAILGHATANNTAAVTMMVLNGKWIDLVTHELDLFIYLLLSICIYLMT